MTNGQLSDGLVDRAAIRALRDFMRTESAGGIVLLAAAMLALAVANSPLSAGYFEALHANLGPLSIHHWINDGLMALFFLLVGLEIKRELLDGHLSSWPRRITSSNFIPCRIVNVDW